LLFECPACGAGCTINKRKVRRTRQTNIDCRSCGAVLGVKGSRSAGAVDVIVVMAGARNTESDLPALPDAAVLFARSEPGFDASTNEKTDPDAAAPIPIHAIPAVPVIPQVGLPEIDEYEAPFGELNEDTDPGTGAPVGGEGAPPWRHDTIRDSSPIQVQRDRSKPVRKSGAHGPVRVGGDSAPAPAHEGPATVESPAPSFFGAAASGSPAGRSRRNRAPSSATAIAGSATADPKTKRPETGHKEAGDTTTAASPVLLELPDPGAHRHSKSDVQQMLQEFSVMFRLDNRSKRRRSAMLTLGAAAVLGVAILAVILATSHADPGVLRAVAESAETLEPVRSTSVRIPGVGGGQQVSALGAKLVSQVRARLLKASAAVEQQAQARAAAQRVKERRAAAARAERVKAAATKAEADKKAARRKRLRRLRLRRKRARAAKSKAEAEAATAKPKRRKLPSLH